MNTSIAAWVTGRLPPHEDLDRARLAELANDLGSERRLWEHLVRFETAERVYVELYRDVHVDVWLICWLNQQDTGFHDHDVSCGAVYVADGTLLEDRLVWRAGVIHEATHEHRAGTVFDFHAGRLHRMRHPGGDPATSVHVYSPPLWRMGHYHFDADGNLSRDPITYADEMWTGRVEGALRFAP